MRRMSHPDDIVNSREVRRNTNLRALLHMTEDERVIGLMAVEENSLNFSNACGGSYMINHKILQDL